MGDEINQSPTG